MARRVPTEHQMTAARCDRARLGLRVPVRRLGRRRGGVRPDRESVDAPRVAARGSAPVARVPIPNSADLSANPYAGISNEQLADVADRWDGLNQDERRWFFVEVRKRLMATDGAPALPIGASARFGQVVPQSRRDGDAHPDDAGHGRARWHHERRRRPSSLWSRVRTPA